MTENKLRSNIANWLVQYIGISEGSAKHAEILKVFNDSKLCSRYKMTKNDAWCAAATSAAFIANGMAGAQGSGKLFECVECGCGRMITYAQQQGIWVESDGYVPKVGDVVMYDWADSGSGDNTSSPDHVGIVVSGSGLFFKVIEGNINNTVGYRTMAVNGRYIRGFITPKYSKFASGAVAETTTPAPSTKPAETKPATTSKPGAPNKTCKFKGTVIASSLNVRSWAGTENKVLRTLAKGKTVEVCDTIQDKNGNDWYYIKESNKYGFVSADYISKKGVTATPAPSTTTTTSSSVKSSGINKTCKFKGAVTAKDGLNVRSWAGTENKILRTLARGKVVEVCDEIKASTGKTWYYIKESNKYGFVSSDYIARL